MRIINLFDVHYKHKQRESPEIPRINFFDSVTSLKSNEEKAI